MDLSFGRRVKIRFSYQREDISSRAPNKLLILPTVQAKP
jgi:hypothetical protein